MTTILAPAAVLVLWSLVIMYWMILTRFPAFGKAGLELGSVVGTRYQDVESALPPQVNWKSHNYTHLMEQPTIFYATVGILALAGAATELNVALAWAYTATRIAHSLWQTLVNKLPVRVALFALSSLILTVLAVNAVIATLG